MVNFNNYYNLDLYFNRLCFHFFIAAQSVYELKDFNGIITLYRKETNHERQQRLRAEAKLRNQRILSSTATSATTSEEDEDDFANFSMNSDISTD